MQTIIDNAIEQINLGTEWILNNAKVDKKKSYKALVKERRTLKKIRRTCDSNPTVVIYGQSQCGKSHLSNSLLSVDGRPMQVRDRMNGVNYDFLTHLNPQGDGEATGLLTRFTIQQQPDVTKDFPVHIKLMSVKDVALMLCDGYYRDLENREPFSTDRIKQLLEELRSRKTSSRQKFICEDDIGEIEEYFHNFSQDLYYPLSSESTDFFGELAMLIENLTENDVVSAINMLWNNDDNMSEKFKLLFDTCKKLDFAGDAYISFRDLINSDGLTLLDVSWLDFKDVTTQLNVRYQSLTGGFKVVNICKATLAAICVEVVLEVIPPCDKENETNAKTQYVRTLLHNVDILDFPGARARGGLFSSSGFMGILLRRGKVGYYFNKYSSERRIKSLLFCWEPDNFDAKPMESILRSWVDTAIGKNEEERAMCLMDMEVPPLFFVGTKFNLHLQAKTSDRADNPDALVNRWEKWFVEQLSKDVIGVPSETNNNSDNYKWFKHWTTSNPFFDNCYLLRDFRYSTSIFEGWTEASGIEDARKAEPYKDFYTKLRNSFINHNFVKNHFRDAANRWDEASEPNCDGSLPIARNLALIAGKIAAAASAKNKRDIKDAINKVITELSRHYYNTDSEENLKKAIGAAARLQASLDIAFGRDPYYFGRFMKAVTVSEYAVHEAFSNVFPHISQSGNMGEYVRVYMKAPSIRSSNSFEENLSILRAAYGFINDEECRKHFEDDLKINLDDLFRKNEFGLRSPSQVLSATLKKFWFEEWLRGCQHDKLCEMLGESVYDEVVNMMESLFIKCDIEQLVSQSIHNYVDTFGINTQDLSEMIADMCSEMINKFVLSVGYDYYSDENGMVENLKEISAKHNIGLNFGFLEDISKPASNSHIATLMAEMDDTERTRMMLMNPNEHSIDELAAVIPGFRQSCNWRDMAKVGYVLTNDIPNYDIEANGRLGKIIEKCRIINE